jgi:hypothetical protein
MMSYDQGRDNFTALRKRYEQTAGDRNEAMTRLQVIDALFFECLGWSKSEDVEVEDSLEGEYADYVFRDKRDLMVTEAKREGDYFEIPAGLKEIERKLGNLLKDNKNIKAACRQAMGYATERGVPIAVVCNGHQIVAFIATRQDGVKPLEGKSLVLGSWSQMDDHFFDLWQALSKPAVLEGRLINRLTKNLAQLVPSPLSARISPYPGTKGRNDFQADLKILSEIVLEDLIKDPEDEEEFLRSCYCQSGTLSQHSLESKVFLIQRYAKIVDESNPGPTSSPAVSKAGKAEDLMGEAIGRRPILLLGDVGVGKTSFIRYLIKVEAKEFFKTALPIYLDLGSKATLTNQFQDVVISEIRRQLNDIYKINILKRNFVLGVYDKDLQEWEEGIDEDIRESNPTLYGERRHKFLMEKQDNQAEHLRRSIQHIVRGQKKPVVLFIDNLDQRSDNNLQQQAFLIAHEISTNWDVTVFVTLRPETFHESRRSGVLSGYHPKAFTVAPPRVDLVIKKRLNFALKIASGEFQVGKLGTSTAKITSLKNILQAFLDTISENGNDIIPCLDNLSGGDVRQSLNIVRDFFGSGHVNTRKIADTPGYRVPVHELLRAIIYGDNVHYDPTQSLLIANLFQVSSPDPKEHFLTPILLLGIVTLRTASSEGGFVLVADLYELAQGLCFSPAQIETALTRCHDKKLLQTSARLPSDSADYVRVTTTGMYHVYELMKTFQYVDAMIVDTPILDATHRSGICDAGRIADRLARTRQFADYLNLMWNTAKLPTKPLDWSPIYKSLIVEIDRISTRQHQYAN